MPSGDFRIQFCSILFLSCTVAAPSPQAEERKPKADSFSTDEFVQRQSLAVAPSEIKDLARSIVALIPKESLERRGDGRWYIIDEYAEQRESWKIGCDREDEVSIVKCAGPIVQERPYGTIILTAGHCLKARSASEYFFVLDYADYGEGLPNRFEPNRFSLG